MQKLITTGRAIRHDRPPTQQCFPAFANSSVSLWRLLEALFNEQALRVSLNTDEDFNLPAARVVVKERNVSETLVKQCHQLRSSGKSATAEMS